MSRSWGIIVTVGGWIGSTVGTGSVQICGSVNSTPVSLLTGSTFGVVSSRQGSSIVGTNHLETVGDLSGTGRGEDSSVRACLSGNRG